MAHLFNLHHYTSVTEIPCPVPQIEEKSRIAEQIPAKRRNIPDRGTRGTDFRKLKKYPVNGKIKMYKKGKIKMYSFS